MPGSDPSASPAAGARGLAHVGLWVLSPGKGQTWELCNSLPSAEAAELKLCQQCCPDCEAFSFCMFNNIVILCGEQSCFKLHLPYVSLSNVREHFFSTAPKAPLHPSSYQPRCRQPSRSGAEGDREMHPQHRPAATWQCL